MATEMSGSRIASRLSAPITTAKGRSPLPNCFTAAPFFTSSIGVHTSTANLASSDGWIDPLNRYRREPYIVLEIASVPGRMTMSMSSRLMPMIGQAYRRQISASTLAQIANVTTPTSTPVNWRSTKKCPGLLAETACSALALYNTASPKAVSTAVTSNSARASSDMRHRSRVPDSVPLITSLTRGRLRVRRRGVRTRVRALRSCRTCRNSNTPETGARRLPTPPMRGPAA